jgi:flagellar hook assembly protein FlgD
MEYLFLVYFKLLNNNNNNNNSGKIRHQMLLWPCTKSVEKSHEGKVTIEWNQQVRPDSTIPNNELDNIILYNTKGTCMIKDVAVPGE